MSTMPTYVVYTPDGTPLGGAKAEDPKEAAEEVVNSVDWGDDAAAVDVNVGVVTDRDYTATDPIDTTDEGIKQVETMLTVKIHD